VRLVAGPDGSVLVGRTLAGRGAWLCGGDLACLSRALRRKVVVKALGPLISEDAAAKLHDELRSHFPAMSPDARD
jgi:predicted RNA-binding protein YlxR (DUF448 family)